MKPHAWMFFVFCFVCQVAFADTLVMKSGENKKGKILEETEKSVLFNSEADGVVVEVPKDTVAIVDKDVQNGETPSKGAVQVFSVAPKKKAKWLPREPENAAGETPAERPSGALPPEKISLGPGSQEAMFQSLAKVIEDWVHSHPEAEKYIQEWMEKFKKPEWIDKLKNNQGEVEKLVKIAKES